MGDDLRPRGIVWATSAFAFGAVMPAAAGTALTLGKANATADTVIAVDVGDRMGFFKEHGVDLTLVTFTGVATSCLT